MLDHPPVGQRRWQVVAEVDSQEPAAVEVEVLMKPIKLPVVMEEMVSSVSDTSTLLVDRRSINRL